MNGELIRLDDALEYFERHKSISGVLRTGASTTPAHVYINSQTNAFLFDRELIEEILDQKDAKGKKPGYLMVHFAAKVDGSPTIVVLGCSERLQDGKTEFYTMQSEYPAGETPGTAVVHSMSRGIAYPEISFK